MFFAILFIFLVRHIPLMLYYLLQKSGNLHSLPRGFTIVELLVVIVIIAVLTTITFVSYIGVSQKLLQQLCNLI